MEKLIAKAEFLVEELNKLCPWAAAERTAFMEYFIKNVCAETLPTGEGKQELMDTGMYWGIATDAVAKEICSVVEYERVKFILESLCAMNAEIASMKCGT